jgi:RNA polymerase sigma factor for flagellar operon FliA
VYFEGYTLQDAGDLLGISKSWASRLHAKILESLATEMRQLNLHD